MVSLTCVAPHPSIPAIDPGVRIGLSHAEGGGLTVHIPATARVLAAIVAAMRDGALAPPPAPDPFWDEIEALIWATRDELLARADHLHLNVQAVSQLRAG